MSEEKKTKKVEEAKKVEPKKVESKKVEPKKAEPKKVEAKKVETKKVEAKKEEPKKENIKVNVVAGKQEKAKAPKVKKEKVKKEKVVLTKEEKEVLKQTKKTNRKLWLEKNKAGIIIGTICAILLAILIGVVSVFFLNDGGRTAVSYKGGRVSKEIFEVYYKIIGPQYSMYYGDDEAAVKQTVANKVGSDFYLKEIAEKQGIKAEKKDLEEIDKQFKNEEFVKLLNEQKIDAKLLRKLYENDVLIAKLIEKQKTKITDAEVNKLIEEKYKDNANLNKYMTRHILFKTTDEQGQAVAANKKEEIRIKAEGILNRAKAGEDFAALASEFSEDGSKANGGVIEMYDDGSLVKEYSAAVLALKPGEIAPALVESQFGFHIIKLDEIVADGRKDILKDEVVEKWYTDMMNKAEVKINQSVVGEVK